MVEVLTVFAIGGSNELLDHIFPVIRGRVLTSPSWLNQFGYSG
jgi:hypothetical protein